MSWPDMSDTPRIIKNTGEPARHPWPDDMLVQGGTRGVVFQTGGGPYRTAFVEAFPRNPDTFLRGEGETLTDAEDACWAKYQRLMNCEHGPFERRQYTNGAGFCVKCGTWMSRVFEPLPAKPKAEANLFDRVFRDRDPDAIAEVLEAVARVDELPPIQVEPGPEMENMLKDLGRRATRTGKEKAGD